MSKEKIVCIEWDDAAFDTGYYDKSKPECFQPVKTRTVGHLIKPSKKAVVIGFERFYDSTGKATDDRHIDTIPRGMIRKVTILRSE